MIRSTSIGGGSRRARTETREAKLARLKAATKSGQAIRDEYKAKALTSAGACSVCRGHVEAHTDHLSARDAGPEVEKAWLLGFGVGLTAASIDEVQELLPFAARNPWREASKRMWQTLGLHWSWGFFSGKKVGESTMTASRCVLAPASRFAIIVPVPARHEPSWKVGYRAPARQTSTSLESAAE